MRISRAVLIGFPLCEYICVQIYRHAGRVIKVTKASFGTGKITLLDSEYALAAMLSSIANASVGAN